MNQKKTFKSVIAGFAILMVLLPPFAALNSLLTRWLDESAWYQPIQEYIVPWQARMVAATISPFGVPSRVTPGNPISAFYMIKGGAAIPVNLSWNCLGWQSMLLLIISLFAGLRGNYTTRSRFQLVAIGLLGTILVNVFRMSVIALGIYYVNSLAAQIVHDYFASFVTLLWIIFFWWFSYRYILLENSPYLNDPVSLGRGGWAGELIVLRSKLGKAD